MAIGVSGQRRSGPLDCVPWPTFQELLAEEGYFLQGKTHCPDEWWVCLRTCRKVLVYFKSNPGFSEAKLKSFTSRPAWASSPHIPLSSFLPCPPLPSIVTCPPPFLIPPDSCLGKEGRGDRRRSPSTGDRSSCSPQVTGSLPGHVAGNWVFQDRQDQVYCLSRCLSPM